MREEQYAQIERGTERGSERESDSLTRSLTNSLTHSLARSLAHFEVALGIGKMAFQLQMNKSAEEIKIEEKITKI